MAASSEMDMNVVFVKDRGGDTLKLQEVDGQYYPTFPPSVLKNMATIKIRSNDVILAGYVKSGTHWFWEMGRMLLAGTTDVINVEKDEAMMEQTAQEVLDSLASPRLLNTHVHFEKLPTEVMTLKPKIIYSTRNPKDTAVSMYNHHRKLSAYYFYEGAFENYLDLFTEGKVDYGSWFDHIKNWSDAAKKYPELNIFEINYEDVSEDPEREIRRLAAFLGLAPSDQLVEQIKQECSLQQMRDKKGKFDLDSEGNPIMYRKGQVGDWKNWFNEDQNSWFDEILASKMAQVNSTFHWRFTLDSA